MAGQAKHFIILGAGISGLSLGWFLKKRFGDEIKLTIVEKGSRVSGWLKSEVKEGCLFEYGPRSFRSGKPVESMLSLVKQVGLAEQLLPCSQDARTKFIYFGKQLWEVPSSFYSFVLSPLMRKSVDALWQEKFGAKGEKKIEKFFRETLGDKFTDFLLTGPLIRQVMDLVREEQKQRPTEAKDETIASFFQRKFGFELTNVIVDAYISGVYAGDIHKLSVKSCLPVFYKAEKEYGSIIKAFSMPAEFEPLIATELPLKPKDPFVLKMRDKGVFSFVQGVEVLPRTLAQKLNAEILLDTPVNALRFDAHGVDLVCQGKVIRGDHLFAAIPAKELAPLVKPWCEEASKLLLQIPYASIAVVNIIYKNRVLVKEKGFGYLIPHIEGEKILGCTWNSVVFPEQYPPNTTSLSVMIGGTRMREFPTLKEQDFKDIALEALSRHMGIKERPDIMDVVIAKDAIPQYILGHSKRLARINSLMREYTPRLTSVGASYYGVGISDCIAQARRIAKRFDE